MMSVSCICDKKVVFGAPKRVNVSLPRVRRSAPRLVIRAANITDVGKYLSEAAQRIFSVQESDVNWKQVASPYEGKFSLEDMHALNKLADEVQAIRGCTDPEASNFSASATVDDGSCIFPTEEERAKAQELGVGGYFKAAIERVFDHNFTGDEGTPTVPITPFTGDIVSQRDIQRLVQFEQFVKKTADDASKQNQK
eukprot:TRINITY_DN1189_c0_g1_i1.p2 TRINITY_DN1189_c0_g1~~TRINITY_DN1189_c0_g1_i1.p2  ORF type:complete len:196 (-),score=38.19 TRINITY_DN1189_c0_g1_i1:213-800(-)